MFYCKSNTVELQLSVLRWTANDPDMQRIRIIELLFENKLHKQLEHRLLIFTVRTSLQNVRPRQI
jgi:hypothetical protein